MLDSSRKPFVPTLWFGREVQPRLRGRAFVIRYSDDFVLGFASEADAILWATRRNQIHLNDS